MQINDYEKEAMEQSLMQQTMPKKEELQIYKICGIPFRMNM